MEKNIDIYNKIEKCDIKAKIFYKTENKKETHIFIFCHGFGSGKGSNSVRVIANKLLQYEISSISFDFPGHIDSVQGPEKLRVEVCISYINSIIEYVKNTYGEDIKISFFAISFGAYILLNKLIGDKQEYENIILRSPAFNMKEILINTLLKEPFEEYKNNGKAKAGIASIIDVQYGLYEDLIKRDLYENYQEKRKILIFQGCLDEIAPIEDTYRFMKNIPEIELVELKNVKHHMEPTELEIVANTMIKKLKRT